ALPISGARGEHEKLGRSQRPEFRSGRQADGRARGGSPDLVQQLRGRDSAQAVRRGQGHHLGQGRVDSAGRSAQGLSRGQAQVRAARPQAARTLDPGAMKGRGDEKQEPWLLIKEKDSYARPASEFSVVDEMPDSVNQLADRPPRPAAAAPGADKTAAAASPPQGARKAALPAALQPELATLVDSPPEDAENWIYEIKFDGYRMLTRVENGELRLLTRNGNDWTAKLAQLARALKSMELPDGWYDGEIIMPGDRVPADFQALQGAFDSERTGDIVYYLFDLPYCAGHDLRDVPLLERRAVLERIVQRKPHPKVRFSAVFDARGEDVLASACGLGLEGVIAKRKNSAYVLRRSSDWVKLKCGRRQEFVIGGYTDPQGARTGIGSLLLGVHDKDGTLRYAGNVGTGFNEQVLRDLRR